MLSLVYRAQSMHLDLAHAIVQIIIFFYISAIKV